MTDKQQSQNTDNADCTMDDSCIDEQSASGCCYVMDPCGCYTLDACGCYVNLCCCC